MEPEIQKEFDRAKNHPRKYTRFRLEAANSWQRQWYERYMQAWETTHGKRPDGKTTAEVVQAGGTRYDPNSIAQRSMLAKIPVLGKRAREQLPNEDAGGGNNKRMKRDGSVAGSRKSSVSKNRSRSGSVNSVKLVSMQQAYNEFMKEATILAEANPKLEFDDALDHIAQNVDLIQSEGENGEDESQDIDGNNSVSFNPSSLDGQSTKNSKLYLLDQSQFGDPKKIKPIKHQLKTQLWTRMCENVSDRDSKMKAFKIQALQDGIENATEQDLASYFHHWYKTDVWPIFLKGIHMFGNIDKTDTEELVYLRNAQGIAGIRAVTEFVEANQCDEALLSRCVAFFIEQFKIPSKIDPDDFKYMEFTGSDQARLLVVKATKELIYDEEIMIHPYMMLYAAKARAVSQVLDIYLSKFPAAELLSAWINMHRKNCQGTQGFRKDRAKIGFPLFYGILQAYQNLSDRALVNLSKKHSAILNDEMIEMVSQWTQDHQIQMTEFLSTCATGSAPASHQCNQIWKVLSQKTHIRSGLLKLGKLKPESVLSIEKLTTLVADLNNVNDGVCYDYLTKCKSLQEAAEGAAKLIVNRASLDVQSATIDNWVNKQIMDARVPQLYETYNEVKDLAKSIQEKNLQSKFEVDPYQAYIVARLYLRKEQFISVRMAQGSGKTITMLLLALMVLKDDQSDNEIYFVVPNEDLRKQFTDDVLKFAPDPRLLVVSKDIWDPEKTKVLFIDEADQYAFNNAIVYSEKPLKLSGIIDLLDLKKVFFFTGTVTKFFSGLMKEVFPADQLAMLHTEFKTRYEICNPNCSDYKIDYHTADNPTALKALFLTKIGKLVSQKPVIIFCNVGVDAMLGIIKPAFQSKTQIYSCDKKEDIDKLRYQLQKKTNGLIVLDVNWARGIDLKLAADAFVAIYAEKEGMNLATIKQMLGRGSRAYGQMVGAYFTDEFRDTTENIEDLLAQKDEKNQNGFTVAGMVIRAWPRLDAKKQKKVFEATKNSAWNHDPFTFRTKRIQTYEILAENSKK